MSKFLLGFLVGGGINFILASVLFIAAAFLVLLGGIPGQDTFLLYAMPMAAFLPSVALLFTLFRPRDSSFRRGVFAGAIFVGVLVTWLHLAYYGLI